MKRNILFHPNFQIYAGSIWEPGDSIREDMEISLIKACVEDAEKILNLQKTAYQSEANLYDDWTIPPLTQTLEEISAEFDICIFIKAIHAGKIAGSVRASFDCDTCRVGRLIVHPDYQGNGIGIGLLLEIENYFSHADRYELFTGSKSSDNIRFYQRLGYSPFREDTLSDNIKLIFMEKYNHRSPTNSLIKQKI